jgi:hypothetical protein
MFAVTPLNVRDSIRAAAETAAAVEAALDGCQLCLQPIAQYSHYVRS